MDAVGWNDILFFPGEDPEALKSSFVELWAVHNERFSVFELSKYIFKDLKDPDLRSGKAAQVWSADLDVLERVRVLRLKGTEKPDTEQTDIERRALQIADSPSTEPKDKIAALNLVARMKGYIKKEIESAPSGGATGERGDFLSELAKRLPA